MEHTEEAKYIMRLYMMGVIYFEEMLRKLRDMGLLYLKDENVANLMEHYKD